MIIFYGEGRLGNQVFQYQALAHLTNSTEKILSIGLEDLQQVFELHGPKLTVLTKNATIKRIVKYLIVPLFLRPLARTLHLINYVFEADNGIAPHVGASGEISMQRGLFDRLTFVDGGYYQNAKLWKDLFPSSLIRVNHVLRAAASDHLTSIAEAGLIPIFVHVRRGDYLSYSTYGLSDLSLPTDFYRTAMSCFKEQCQHTHFVFVTDDPQWVEDNFHDVRQKTIVSSNAALDFAIMTKCRGGILSNSTFSLAATFMLDKPDLVIAPRFWFGFRITEWLPPHIEVAHEKMLYLPVLSESLTT